MQTCFHCEISIDPRFDEPHTVLIEGDSEVICDSCYCDYKSFGETFGDEFYKRYQGHECCHKVWAAEETAIREGMSA